MSENPFRFNGAQKFRRFEDLRSNAPAHDGPTIRITPRMLDDLGSAELTKLRSATDEIVERVLREQAATRERAYWKMIAAGQLPSQGWRIGERTWVSADGTSIEFECVAIPPSGV